MQEESADTPISDCRVASGGGAVELVARMTKASESVADSTEPKREGSGCPERGERVNDWSWLGTAWGRLEFRIDTKYGSYDEL